MKNTKKRYTRRESLKYCLKMWTILAKQGGASKDDVYADMRRKDKSLPESVDNDCFACEYLMTHKGSHCDSKCIMDGAWGEGKHSCQAEGNNFQKWEYARTPKTRRKYAQLIADGAKRALKRLKP